MLYDFDISSRMILITNLKMDVNQYGPAINLKISLVSRTKSFVSICWPARPPFFSDQKVPYTVIYHLTSQWNFSIRGYFRQKSY